MYLANRWSMFSLRSWCNFSIIGVGDIGCGLLDCGAVILAALEGGVKSSQFVCHQ